MEIVTPLRESARAARERERERVCVCVCESARERERERERGREKLIVLYTNGAFRRPLSQTANQRCRV